MRMFEPLLRSPGPILPRPVTRILIAARPYKFQILSVGDWKRANRIAGDKKILCLKLVVPAERFRHAPWLAKRGSARWNFHLPGVGRRTLVRGRRGLRHFSFQRQIVQ